MIKSEPVMNLRQLIDQSTQRISCASEKQSRIINDIDPKLEAGTGQKKLGQVMHNLLSDARLHSDSYCIRVTAKAFHNIILIQIRHNDKRPGPVIEKSFSAEENLAAELGGCLYITGSKINGTTITFTFLNQSQPTFT